MGKEILGHVNEALEELEERLSRKIKDSAQTNQLAEIDFRKKTKEEAFQLRQEMESAARRDADRLAELERRGKLNDSYYRELKAGLEDITDRLARGVIGPIGSGRDADVYATRAAVENLSIKIQSEFAKVQKDMEKRVGDTQTQVIECGRVLDQLVTTAEQAHRSRDEQVSILFDRLKDEYQARIDSSVADVHSMVTSVKRQADAVGEHTDLLATQIANRMYPLRLLLELVHVYDMLLCVCNDNSGEFTICSTGGTRCIRTSFT
jgi:Mg2+ and Co2+ transporter CorA